MRGFCVARAILDRLLAENAKYKKGEGACPRVLVYVDPDIDGVVAARVIMSWLDEHDVPYKWYCNTGRAHGFFLTDDGLRDYLGDERNGIAGGYIIHGDFTIEFDKLKDLVSKGLFVLSTDHHEVPYRGDKGPVIYAKGKMGVLQGVEPKGADPQGGEPVVEVQERVFNDSYESADIMGLGVIINNQYDFEPDSRRYQSGTGVIADVLRGYSGSDWGGEPLNQLVGWTLLSDVRDISGAEAKWWLSRLFSWNYGSAVSLAPGSLSGVLKHVVDEVMRNRTDWNFGVVKMTRTFVDYTLSPAINALFRFDLENDAVRLMLGGEYPKYRGRYGRNWQEYQRAVRDEILAEATVTRYGEGFVVLDISWPYKSFILSECRVSNFIGLAASQLMDAEDSCVLAISRGVGGEVERASFRGKYNLPYREELARAGVLQGAGHSAAFGVPGMSKEVDFEGIGRVVNRLLDEYKATNGVDKLYIVVDNLGPVGSSGAAEKLAEYNEYAPSSQKVYLKYTGAGIDVLKASAKRVVFSVDGVEVLYFGKEASDDVVKGGFLAVSKGRNGVEYTLER